jgi:hypothetical protein
MTCHFISNRDLSTTAIYVKDVDAFFHPADTQLGNFLDKTFYDLHFAEPIKRNAPGQELTLVFDVTRGDNNELPEIELTVDGLIPQTREGLALPEGFTQISDVAYSFTPTASHVSIPLITSDSTGEVYLQLTAEDYESQSLKTHHFTLFNGIGFFDGHGTSRLGGWSNVVYGMVNSDNGKNVLFGYYDDPEDLNPTISLLNRQSLTPHYPKASEYPWTPNGPQSTDGAYNYHELEFKTNNGDPQLPASFTLSSPGYLEVPIFAPRFRGNIFTYQNTGVNSNHGDVSKDARTITANMDKDVPHQSTVTFSDNFRVETDGIWLDAGQTGTISITNTNTSSFRLFYVQFNVGTKNSTRQFPSMEAELPEGEIFFKYPGRNDQCIWLRPDKTGDATITITAESSHAFQITGIVLKTFRYKSS